MTQESNFLLLALMKKMATVGQWQRKSETIQLCKKSITK